MKHLLRIILICGTCLIIPLQNSRAEEDREILALDRAVSLALRSNPDLAAMKARARAMEEIPAQRGSLEDPMLSIRAANFPLDTFAIDQEPMTQIQIALSQALPFPGKLSLRRLAAEMESRAADFSYEEERLMLIQDVKTLWWNIYYLDRALETVERNRQLYRQFNTIAQTKYEVGGGLQQDVLRAQLELSKLLDTRINLEKMRANETVRLNTLLARPPGKPIILPLLKEADFPEIPSLAQLVDRAITASPVILDWQSRADAARTRLELAEMQFLPDFIAGATYGYREGSNLDGSERADFATLSITLKLPFFYQGTKESAVNQRQMELLQQERKLHGAMDTVQAKVATARSDYEKYREKTELLEEGIIPLARQTLDSVLAGYQVNKVDFQSLVEAQASLYNYETSYWQALSSAYQALARLAAAIGEENTGS